MVRLSGTFTEPELILMAGNLDTKLVPGSKLVVTRVPGVAPDYSLTNTGAHANNNTSMRKAAFIYTSYGVSLAGLALAIDAILQPMPASSR